MNRYLSLFLPGLVCLVLFGTVYADEGDPSDVIKELLYQSTQEISLQENQPFFILNISPKASGTMQPDLSDLRLFSNDVELGYAQIPPQRVDWSDGDMTINNQKKESEVVIDLHHLHRISSEWVVYTEEKGFYRQVITEGSGDQEQWRTLGSSFIYRGLNETDESISFRYGPEKYRYIRIRIKNEDNEPLNISDVKLKVHPLEILVKSPAAAGSFSLNAYWGNQNLEAPAYEVKEFITSVGLDQLQAFILGEYEHNPNYEPTQPTIHLTERYPFLLPLVLIMAVGFVAYILFRNLKQIKP